MGKRLMVGERAQVGDYIQNDQLRQKWVACRCSNCGGSGSVSDGWMVIDCPNCEGLKIIWKEVEYV